MSQVFLSVAFMEKMRELSVLVDGDDCEWKRRFPAYMSSEWLKDLYRRA